MLYIEPSKMKLIKVKHQVRRPQKLKNQPEVEDRKNRKSQSLRKGKKIGKGRKKSRNRKKTKKNAKSRKRKTLRLLHLENRPRFLSV